MEHFDLNKLFENKKNNFINTIILSHNISINYENMHLIDRCILIIGNKLDYLNKYFSQDNHVIFYNSYEKNKSPIYKFKYDNFFQENNTKILLFIDLDHIDDFINESEIQAIFLNSRNWNMQSFIFVENPKIIFQKYFSKINLWIFNSTIIDYKDTVNTLALDSQKIITIKNIFNLNFKVVYNFNNNLIYYL